MYSLAASGTRLEITIYNVMEWGDWYLSIREMCLGDDDLKECLSRILIPSIEIMTLL